MRNTSGTRAARLMAGAAIGSGAQAKGAAISPPAGPVDKFDKLDRPEHAAARTTCISTHPLYWGIGGGLVSYGLLSPTLRGRLAVTAGLLVLSAKFAETLAGRCPEEARADPILGRRSRLGCKPDMNGSR